MPIGSKRHAEGPGSTELRCKVGMWAAIRAWKLGRKLESCDNFCQIQSPKGDLTHFSKYSKILTYNGTYHSVIPAKAGIQSEQS